MVSPLLLWMTERKPKQMRRVLGCPKPLRAEGPARGGHMLGVCYGCETSNGTSKIREHNQRSIKIDRISGVCPIQFWRFSTYPRESLAKSSSPFA